MIKEFLQKVGLGSRSKLGNPQDVPFGSAFLSPTNRAGAAPRLGTKEMLLSYSTMPWLRATVNKVGRSVGTVNWTLFAVTENGRPIRSTKIQRAEYESRQELLKRQRRRGDLREIQDHPLLDLFDNGNRALIGKILFQLTQQHIDLVGEAFWLLEKNGVGSPVAAWPLPPDWVRRFPTEDDPTYGIVVGPSIFDIPVTEVIPFIDPDPANPYGRGSGLGKSLGDELEVDEFSAKHLKSFFLNRARPDIIITGDGLARADTERLEQQWLEKHSGFWNQFKPRFLSKKVDIKEIGQTMEEMKITELRKSERDTIIQVFGMPPEKLGILSASNRSTIAAADAFWVKDILSPRLEFMRSVLQKHLVPMFDERLVLDFELPIVKDPEHTREVMSSMPGAFTRNEWRAEANIDALDEEQDGEVFIMRAGEVERPVGGDLKLGEDEDPAEPEPEDDSDEEEEEEDETEQLSAQLKENVLQQVRSRMPQLIEQAKAKVDNRNL